jgi:hypothetical protein
MLNLIRLSILALFTFASPALALAYCNVPIFSPTFKDLADCVEYQASEISLQASKISRLEIEISTLQMNLEMQIDTLRTKISTLEMQIPRPRTYQPPLNKPVSPKDTKIQPEKN